LQQGDDESPFDLNTKAVQAEHVWSKSVSNQRQFILEDVIAFRTYLPMYCSMVTDTPHFDRRTKGPEAEYVSPKSVSNKEHFTLEDVTVFVPISPRTAAE
jgi:hypothetical protein